jgi:acetyl esterase/lipase
MNQPEMHANRSLCLVLVAMLAPLACAAADDAAAPAAIAPVTITYGKGLTQTGEADLLLDLLQPPERTAGLRPVLVAIHGGSFRTGSRTDRNLAAMGQGLAAGGYAVVSMGYRLAPDNPVLSPTYAVLADALLESGVMGQRQRAFIEAMLVASEDLLTLLRWIDAHGAAHGLDRARVVLLGSSAGAVTALQVAYGAPGRIAGELPVRIIGVVDLWGALPGARGMPRGGPPLLIVHGDQDPTVPVSAAHDLVRLAEAAGITHTAHILPGRGHGFRANPPLTTEVAPGVTIYAAVAAFVREVAPIQPVAD